MLSPTIHQSKAPEVIKAYGSDFFAPDAFPITVKTIHGDAPDQHEMDLTDVRHTHNFDELVIITEGAGVHWIDGETYSVSAGDVFFIQGATEHYFLERHGLSLFNIMFDSRFLEKHLGNLRKLPGYNVLFVLEPSYRKRHHFNSRLRVSTETLKVVGERLHAMAVECRAELPGYDSLLLASFIEIIVLLAREYTRVSTPQVRSLLRLGKAISELERQSRKEWTLSEIAHLASLAPSTLIPMFRQATGVTPIQYLIRARLRNASGLLTSTDLPISEIAGQCGFTDSNYFTRQFRKLYGIAPGVYRLRNGV